jgi:Cu-Zn family superoxide dismutase
MTRATILGALLACGAFLPGAVEAQMRDKADLKAKADIKNEAGKTVGEATLQQRDGGVEITAHFTGLPQGTRAIHIHEVGKCEAPFESAGGHFNPTAKQHGKDNPSGPHAGDLPNLNVPATGRVKLQTVVKGITLDGGGPGLLDADGAALVVHEGTDDYKSDPAGNAGKRIACGVIRR